MERTSPEVEANVLSGLFQHPALFDHMKGRLTAGHFKDPTHKQVFAAMCSCRAKHQPVDVATVSEALYMAHGPKADTTAIIPLACSSTSEGTALREIDALVGPVAEVQVTTPVNPLVVVNAADLLLMDLPERGHVLHPIIPEQGLCMLHAARGLGKTWAALSIAYAVASGQKVFGRWLAPAPRRVLYLDGEMPATAMRERLAQIIAGYERGLEDPDNLKILTPDLQPDFMPNIAREESQALLAPYLEGVDFMVVDNLATLGRHGRENEAESWQPLQAWFLSLRRAGKSVLIVHHSGKGGGQRGTSAKEDVLDTVIALRRPEDYTAEQGARFEVHLEKARGLCGDESRAFEATLRMDHDKAVWSTMDIQDLELETVRRLTAEGMSAREIADETGMSKSKANRLQKRIKGGQS